MCCPRTRRAEEHSDKQGSENTAAMTACRQMEANLAYHAAGHYAYCGGYADYELRQLD